MNSELLEAARPALEAWQRGEVEPLAGLLDPEVELLSWESSEFDCHGREEVLTLLGEQAADRAATTGIELIDAGQDAIVSTRTEAVAEGPASGLRPATLITFRDGLAISMRQFRSREEALAAAR